MLTSEMCRAHCRPSFPQRLARALRAWWRRHVAGPEPTPASDLPPRPVILPRVIRMAFRRPNGELVTGWRCFAHNDGERAEVLWAAWVGSEVAAR